MSEIEAFLDRIAADDEERSLLHFDPDNVHAMHSYASALLDWERDGFNSNSFMSTDNSMLLGHREQLGRKFGLPILDKRGGEDREKALGESMPVFRTDVSKGFLN